MLEKHPLDLGHEELKQEGVPAAKPAADRYSWLNPSKDTNVYESESSFIREPQKNPVPEKHPLDLDSEELKQETVPAKPAADRYSLLSPLKDANGYESESPSVREPQKNPVPEKYTPNLSHELKQETVPAKPAADRYLWLDSPKDANGYEPGLLSPYSL